MQINMTEPGKWRFFTDQVMGGVSTGQAELKTDGATPYILLSGTVSTENRGGFIQVRRDLDQPLSPKVDRLTLTIRGNGQTYFVHLRTKQTRLPWQYYQAAFRTADTWSRVTLSLENFRPSGGTLPDTPAPEAITSIGLVAYGRDHTADVALARIEFGETP